MSTYFSLPPEVQLANQLLIGKARVRGPYFWCFLIHVVPVGWRGNFLLSAAEQWLKHELSKNFKVIRDLELLPQLLGQDWSSVFLQRFEGAVT
jgi:hypothetical protein